MEKRVLTDDEKKVRKLAWEARCRLCGECCRLKFYARDGVTVLVSEEYCPALDVETKFCMIYESRMDPKWDALRGGGCYPASRAIMVGVHPSECAYVKFNGVEFKVRWPGVSGWRKFGVWYWLKWKVVVAWRRRAIRKAVGYGKE